MNHHNKLSLLKVVSMVNCLTLGKNLDRIRCITELQVLINSNLTLNTIRTTDYTLKVQLVYIVIEKSQQPLFPRVLTYLVASSKQYNF